MALYSFNHESFGKTTTRRGAAGDNAKYNADLSKTQLDQLLAANARAIDETGEPRSDEEIERHAADLRQGRSAAENAAYNARREATYAIRSHVIPRDPDAAKAWFDAQEKADRKNARMSDRFIAALPRELTPEQCIDVVERFCKRITQDRIPWHFALHLELEHQLDPDWNPHTHIIFRDRDIETGRRFLYTSASYHERQRLDAEGIQHWSTKDFRVAWNDELNQALERAGHEARVDHRSLKAQGVDRTPQIHLGRAGMRLAAQGTVRASRDQAIGNRIAPYTVIDRGQTRVAYNHEILAANAQRDRATKQRAAAADRTRDPAINDNPDPHIARTWQQVLAATAPRTEQHQQAIELQRAQDTSRKAGWNEQRADRAALKSLHDAQIKEHRAWSRQLNAAARVEARQQTDQRLATRTRDIFGMPKGSERDKAVAVHQQRTAAAWTNLKAMPQGAPRETAADKLRADSAVQRQAIYGMPYGVDRDAAVRKLNADRATMNREATAAKIAAIKPQKDAAWSSMITAQKLDRADLKSQHMQESASLARQHAAERNALSEQWRAVYQADAAARAMHNLAKARPGMAAQQAAAIKVIQTQHRAATPQPPSRPGTPPQSPQEAAHYYVRMAHQEHDRRSVQRQVLTQQRGDHFARGQAVLVNAAARTPVGRGTQAGQITQALSQLRNEEPQRQARQAAQSGRPLTTAERANAPPELRQKLDARDRRTAAKRIMLERRNTQAQAQARDRGGGRQR